MHKTSTLGKITNHFYFESCPILDQLEMATTIETASSINSNVPSKIIKI
jgi:hypothetical protein